MGRMGGGGGEVLGEGFVKRYNRHETGDGLAPGEGAFLACSFWLADAYVSLSRQDDADKMLERLLSIRNDLVLLAEEYDTANGRLIGNYPPTLPHVALINTPLKLPPAPP